jgi:hypothetical protein
MVLIDPTEEFKDSPKVLAKRSGVPHIVRGRYMFRVDDLVRPAGCSNKTGGACKNPLLFFAAKTLFNLFKFAFKNYFPCNSIS